MKKYKFGKFVLSFVLVLSMLVSSGAPVGAIGSQATEEPEDVNIYLPDGLPEGEYTLKYEGLNGVLEEYADICTVEVGTDDDSAAYSGFIKENVAPSEASVIGVYNTGGERVGEIDIEALSYDAGEKLYSFGLLSDVHIQSATAADDYKRALTYYNKETDVDFIAVAGDITQSGTREHLATYKAIVDEFSPNTRVYETSGNHEGQQKNLSEYISEYTGESVYYSFTHGNDVFIMVGNTAAAGEIFTTEELQWLYETLEANKDKRCFVFQHVPSDTTSGNALGVYEHDIWDGVDAAVYESLVKHYPNIIWFHGHSHLKFRLQNFDKKANYDSSEGFHSVHVPSLAVPRDSDALNNRVEVFADSEGYVVDVYENSVVLRGRDFVTGKFLPIAQYCLDTTTKDVAAESYYDSTGTIMNSTSNVLKAGSTWYQSELLKSYITKITITDKYIGTYDEKWDATAAESGEVTVYRKGYELYIEGSERGVVANANSSGLFSGFTSLETIDGFEKINFSNATDVSSLFKNSVCLNSVNLSGLGGATPTNVVEMFSGCRSLKEIDLTALDMSKAYKYNNMFYNCASLESVKLAANAAQNATTVYAVSMFKGCSVIKTIDLSMLSGKGFHLGATFEDCKKLETIVFGSHRIVGMNGTFAGCYALKTLDISGFDFSSLDNMGRAFENCGSLVTLYLPDNVNLSKMAVMDKTFRNCPKLYLDCSEWDVEGISMVSFNEGSPYIVMPGTKVVKQSYPLIVDTSSYFWMRKESGLQVAQTYETPDLFNVTAQKDDNVLKLTGGTGFERLSEENTFWAGVIKYDDGTCKPCIVTAVDTENKTVTVYPNIEKKITRGQFTALLSDSQHLTELGYKAYSQYVYGVNPKYCDKNIAVNRYAPTSVEEMSTPYKRLPGTPDIYKGKRNDYSAWSMSQSVYGTFLIPYKDYLTEGEYGFEREIIVDGKEGFYETYIGTVYYAGVTDVTKLLKDKGHEMHIEWYVDGELVSSTLKNTNYVERFCFDVPQGARKIRIKVYYTQMRLNKDDTISIGDSTLWKSSGYYGEQLIEPKSNVVQMFDSWGAFWANGKSVTENGVVYAQGASGKEFARLLAKDKSVFKNRSIGGMTSRYGESWLDKTVIEKQPDYVLLDYGINDYHSTTGSVFPNEQTPDGSLIDMSVAMTQDEFSENMYTMFAEATSAGVTPIYVCGFIAQGPSWNTEFINDYVDYCENPPFELLGKKGTTFSFEENIVIADIDALESVGGLFIRPVGSKVITPALDNGFYGTGTKIILERNGVIKEYILIVAGDVAVDGVCDVIDAATTQLFANGFYEPTKEEIYAANGCISDEIDVMSYQNVVNRCLRG